jgi:hypothetical protein
MSHPEQLHWTERLVVTVATAAAVLDRNEAWVRSQIVCGRLEGVQLTPAGALMIRTESLKRLADEAQPVTRSQLAALKRRARQRPHRPQLRLVVDNPKE